MSSTNEKKKKRNRNVLSIEKKIEIIKKLDKRENVQCVMKFYNVGKFTIYDLKN